MKTSAKDSIFSILWLLSGLAMTAAGVYAIFNGHEVVGLTSRIIGICSIVCGIIAIASKLKISSITGAAVRLQYIDSVLLILFGILFLNTRILNRLGKLMFIIVGLIMIYNAAESIFAAWKSRKNEEGWFIPRIVVSVLLLIAGIWVFSNAGRVFFDMAGIIAGVYFIMHGIETVSDWIGRERYRRNFAYLDDDDL